MNSGMDTGADRQVVYSVEDLTRLIEDLKHEEPEVRYLCIFHLLPLLLDFYVGNCSRGEQGKEGSEKRRSATSSRG
jgi:hypothetical protein